MKLSSSILAIGTAGFLYVTPAFSGNTPTVTVDGTEYSTDYNEDPISPNLEYITDKRLNTVYPGTNIGKEALVAELSKTSTEKGTEHAKKIIGQKVDRQCDSTKEEAGNILDFTSYNNSTMPAGNMLAQMDANHNHWNKRPEGMPDERWNAIREEQRWLQRQPANNDNTQRIYERQKEREHQNQNIAV